MINFKGGRLPAQPARPHLKLARLLHDDLAAPPATADWLSPVPVPLWGMLGNDQYGDCTCAGVAHMRIGDCYVNQNVQLAVSTADTLALYSRFGFNADDPSTDRGAVCQDVLTYWQKHGFLGSRILAFAKVDVSNLAEVKQAINLFGQIYCGFNVPQSAMDQFNAGEPWDVVKHSPVEGGHCVTVGTYDHDGLTAVTWGATQKLTWNFWRNYFDEAWVVIGPDDIDPKTGLDHRGVNLTTLETNFGKLTGRRLGDET